MRNDLGMPRSDMAHITMCAATYYDERPVRVWYFVHSHSG